MIATALLSLALVQTAATAQPTADPKDVETPQAVVNALYSVISGPKGEKRNWNRFKSLFTKNGSLNGVALSREGKPSMFSLTLDEYITNFERMTAQTGFWEEQAGEPKIRKGEYTAHIESNYLSRHAERGSVVQTGINYIQLTSNGQRWFITSITWEPTK